MDNQAYLNQISASVRPNKAPSKLGKIFSSTISKVIIGGILVFALLAIIGAIISGSRGSVKDDSIRLMLHINNTSEIISAYQPSVKSSTLRGSSSSLTTILSNTNRELTDYLVTTQKFTEKSITTAMSEEATLARDALNQELFEAKINGILDRIYAHKIAYEIALIMNEESHLYSTSSDDTLKSLLENSYNSLDNLYTNFNDFSETR